MPLRMEKPVKRPMVPPISPRAPTRVTFKSKVQLGLEQGPTGRCFQLRDGSGSGIGKNFGFGFGYGSGSGIGTIFLINRVLSGIQNLDRVFFAYIPNTAFTLEAVIYVDIIIATTQVGIRTLTPTYVHIVAT